MTNTDPWKLDEHLFPVNGSISDRLRFLLQYAVLAPSSHNTQPWKFRIDGNRIDLFLDETRWLRVCDKDQRELHISVGCCVENLLVAADHFGLRHKVEYLPDSSTPLHAASVEFMAAVTERDSRLFPMIPVRHTNHGEYDGRPIPEDVLELLYGCCTEPNIHVQLTSDHLIKQKVDALVVHADAIEFADPAFREELGYWIGQGVFGTSWLMSKIGKLAVTHINMGASTAKKDSAVLMSSPVLGLISSNDNSRATQIRVGQIYQRLSLMVASFGIWCQPMSQIVQVEETKQEVAKLQPDPHLFPQLPFRLGFAEAEKHRTPRRSLAEVLVE
ncbi:Acg family FMN-binding oxidoreductase [Pirellulaceae bacterium SH449]